MKRAGGSRKNFAAPAEQKGTPNVAGFVGGLVRTPSQPGYISRPGGEYAD
ncbi:hypothetical protein [Klebsiella pneumoniae IS46]|nr:hypothetical protein [Klebsiella pneumoniae IS46]